MTTKIFDYKILKDIPPGTWVAISHDQEFVAGAGHTIDEALAAARKKGENQPFVFRIPEENYAWIL